MTWPHIILALSVTTAALIVLSADPRIDRAIRTAWQKVRHPFAWPLRTQTLRITHVELKTENGWAPARKWTTRQGEVLFLLEPDESLYSDGHGGLIHRVDTPDGPVCTRITPDDLTDLEETP